MLLFPFLAIVTFYKPGFCTFSRIILIPLPTDTKPKYIPLYIYIFIPPLVKSDHRKLFSLFNASVQLTKQHFNEVLRKDFSRKTLEIHLELF